MACPLTEGASPESYDELSSRARLLIPLVVIFVAVRVSGHGGGTKVVGGEVKIQVFLLKKRYRLSPKTGTLNPLGRSWLELL